VYNSLACTIPGLMAVDPGPVLRSGMYHQQSCSPQNIDIVPADMFYRSSRIEDGSVGHCPDTRTCDITLPNTPATGTAHKSHHTVSIFRFAVDHADSMVKILQCHDFVGSRALYLALDPPSHVDNATCMRSTRTFGG
jgi:hypothetical protein